MRHSIRFKITFLLTAMIVLTIFLTWFVNSTYLSKFYIYTKTKALNEAYNEIVYIYENSVTGYLSDEETYKMEKLALKHDIEISVFNNKFMTIYPAPNNVGERQADFLDMRIVEYLFPGTNRFIENKVRIKGTDKFDYFTFYDRQTESNYMDLVGTFYNPNNSASLSYDDTTKNYTGDNNTDNNTDSSTSGQSGNSDSTTNNDTSEKNTQNPDNFSELKEDNSVVLIRTNVENLEESASLANEFLEYIGIVAVIIGSAAMFIISRRFTKPILELAGIAKKMSDLDFEVKYEVKSKDEIGELGSSINSLSDKLEVTITELKQANNELMTDLKKKTEIDEMRKEFLSNVSHELKTPISLIQGYAEGLKENINEDPESRDFYCEVIMDEASKMNQMVKKLLSLNEMEFGNNKMNFERFDIVSLIQSVLGATDILFKQKEVMVIFEQTEPVYVWADEYLIEQVITNYISNALNHVSGQKIIEIKLIPHDDTIRVAVFNTGDNIPEEDLDKIWIKFYKVDKARTREYGGSGIGLSIVRAIMNSHNRECGVINRQIGVEFWFELDTKS